MSLRRTLVSLGAFATTTLAHGIVSDFLTDGTFNQGFLLDYYYVIANGGTAPDIASWYAENLDNGFVEPSAYATADINCHKNSKPGALTATVAAGGAVDFQWTAWPHGIGPMLTYVAACDGDCSAADPTTLKWVKIDEAGFDTTTQTWAAQTMIDNNNTWTTTVPANIKAGNYVFRHETIALHGATAENGAQHYPQCMNIEITGSGTELPEGTLGSDLYTATDPGILFNPYTTITEYIIPGPTLFGSSGSAPSTGDSTTATAVPGSPAPSSSVEPIPPTTLVTSTRAVDTNVPVTSPVSSAPTPTIISSTVAAPSETGTVGTQALYGQCGGTNWQGATTCVAGSTCTSYNPYYSQCVPA